MSSHPRLITAEEFLYLPDSDQPKELVKGKIVFLSIPFPRHGFYCARIAELLSDTRGTPCAGWIIINKSGVITERDPDTVRSPDIAYYSYERLPEGRLPDGYAPASPNLVIEVESRDDDRKEMLKKVAEYLFAEVQSVCLVDPDLKSVNIFSADQPVRVLTVTEEWTLPEVLPGFSLKLSELFIA